MNEDFLLVDKEQKSYEKFFEAHSEILLCIPSLRKFGGEEEPTEELFAEFTQVFESEYKPPFRKETTAKVRRLFEYFSKTFSNLLKNFTKPKGELEEESNRDEGVAVYRRPSK